MHGYAMNKKDLQDRLRRIEGQVRGLQRMVDEDTYCIDIFTQLNSVKCGAPGRSAWACSMRTFATASARASNKGRGDEKVVELMAAVGRLAGR